MRFLLLFVFLLVAVPALAQKAVPVAKVDKIVLGGSVAPSGGDPQVAELFSSSACGFCPQAKEAMAAMNARDSVIAYTCPVNYFKGGEGAQGYCRRRQDFYSANLRSGPVYTPQVVIGGQEEAIGTRPALVENVLGKGQAVHTKRVQVEPAKDMAQVYKLGFPALELSQGIQATVVFLKKDTAEGPPVFDRADLLMDWDGSAQALEVEISMTPAQTGFIILAQDQTSGAIYAAGEYMRR